MGSILDFLSLTDVANKPDRHDGLAHAHLIRNKSIKIV